MGEPQYVSSIVAGSQLVNVSPVEGDPEATISKMDTIINAALAPQRPSDQDKEVAALALSRKEEAIKEIKNVEKRQELEVGAEEQKAKGEISDTQIEEVKEKNKDTKEADLSIQATTNSGGFIPNFAPDLRRASSPMWEAVRQESHCVR